jgi:hypothetical protein
MGFLHDLDVVAQDLFLHQIDGAKQTCPTPTAAYKHTLDMILDQVDQLAYVFIVAPFCYDTEQMYEKLKHSLCGILQLIAAQRHQQKATLSALDDDFLVGLSETLTTLCVRMLCDSHFVKMDTCPVKSLRANTDPL